MFKALSLLLEREGGKEGGKERRRKGRIEMGGGEEEKGRGKIKSVLGAP